MTILVKPREARGAVLDDAHVGHIHGAFGTILHGDIAPRTTWKHRLTTLLAILGPGLIVMVGDNDAGAFATHGQAGQNYGTTLLWTLALLIPVLYVNQEMVLRLGAVTGVGHARLIFERFGKFWGAFSVIDLFMLNALTIVTEFIGISLALHYLGLDKTTGVSCRLSGPMSSLERARPLLHEGRFARPVRGKREWDENENEAESWQVERTALRQPPQAFEKLSRRARRKTPFSPSAMASIARRLLNGRRVSFRPTCEWVRKISVQNLSLSKTK